MSAAKIREVLERYGETYDTRKGGTVWEVQGTPVISHKCLERVAARAGIAFDLPTILRAERDEAVIMVAGSLDKRREWSIGEALVNINYRVSGKQAAYVYAMAEKRGKDRVILKLVELHGLAYSEDEADDFKQPSTQPAPPADLRNVHDLHTNGKPIQRNRSQEIAGEMLTSLWRIAGDKAVTRWLALDAVKRDLDALDETDRDRVLNLAEERREADPVPVAEAAR
ncbi:trna delta -isopentenylpyrophosphate transferase [Methylobacterium sp. E-005]|uniref:trna delta -isopentenylpyrophosphate transferase n=1 Tax=Methylobacterium sp. E-005 TaxID=2836549 RepID=UPI001FB95F42|nr:trna delta -isopentenylpyrophosphate transferase [Methylobacterium sp. E-005]MCJ2085014.1 trna delta -isopentenylpyrophosphate transferase [Methylobacterium sp. E-005]